MVVARELAVSLPHLSTNVGPIGQESNVSRVRSDYVTGSREHPTNGETAPRSAPWWHAITFTGSPRFTIVLPHWDYRTILSWHTVPITLIHRPHYPTIIHPESNERPSPFCFPRRRGTVAIVSARMGVNLCVLTDGGCSPDIARRPLIFNPHREAATAAAAMRRTRRSPSARAHSRAANPSIAR